MEHLPLDIICRIADGDLTKKGTDLYSNHLASCKACQREIELQRSIIKVSRKAQLKNPSKSFTEGILDAIIPSMKKKWYEWILQNMGNVIAMAFVLTILGYVMLNTDMGTFENSEQTKNSTVSEFVKIIQEGNLKFTNYLMPKLNIQNTNTSNMNTIVFAILAIILLVFIDRITGYFVRHLKADL